MKYLTAIVLCLASLSAYAANRPVGEVLAKMPVNHLQLIAQNLTTLMLINKLEKDLESPDKTKEYEIQSIHFYTANNSLRASIRINSPYTEVTQSNCSEGLSALQGSIFSDEFSFVIISASIIDLSLSQAKELLDSMALSLTMRANENKELRVTCH